MILNPNNLIEKASNIWLDGGDLKQAQLMLNRVIKSTHNNTIKSKALMYLGYVRDRQLHHDEALMHFNEAISIAEKNKSKDVFILAYSLHGKGSVLRDLEKYEEAASCFYRALELYELNSKDWGAYKEISASGLVLVLIFKGDSERAQELLDRFIQKNILPSEDIGELLMFLGHSYYKKEEYESAKEHYERALILVKNYKEMHSETLHFLGRTSYMMRDYKKAKEYFEKSIPLTEDDEMRDTAKNWLLGISKLKSNED